MKAPAHQEFPAFPASWYLVGMSSELRDRPWSRVVAGRRRVFYRTADGTPVAMDAQCAHLGADLGRGTVADDRVRCPFHGWEFGPDGQCRTIPSTERIPASATLKRYPVVERWGRLFCFDGNEALFPFPSFESDDLVAGKPFVIEGDWPWYLMVANGFDAQHMRTVHDRRLLDEPRVDTPADWARRVRYHTEVCGNSFANRLIRLGAGSEVRVSITVWGGTLVLVEARFARARSFIFFAVEPLGPERARMTVLSLAPRTRSPLRSLELAIRRRLTITFLGQDLQKLEGVRYHPGRLIETDAVMLGFLRWLADLPRLGKASGNAASGPAAAAAALET